MRINLRNEQRARLFGVEINPHQRPTVVRPSGCDGRVVHLDWDRAIDDEQHLRHCPVCGCAELFTRKQLPQLTSFSLIVLAAVISMILFGLRLVRWALLVLAVTLAIDLIILVFGARVLVCYRCHSEYRRTPIRRDHPTWETAIAKRYRPPRALETLHNAR